MAEGPSLLLIEWDGRPPISEVEAAAAEAGFREVERSPGISPPPSVPAALVGLGLDRETVSGVRIEAELEGWNSLLIYPVDLAPVAAAPEPERAPLLARTLAAARAWCERSSEAASIPPVISAPSGPIRRRDLLRVGAAVLRRKEHPILSSQCGGSLAEACSACVEACPVDAVRLEGGLITVDRTACEACGLCASVCPTGSLEVPTLSRRQVRGLLEASSPPADRSHPWLLVLTPEEGLFRLSRSLIGREVGAAVLPWRVPSAAAAGPAALLQAASSFDGILVYCPEGEGPPGGIPDSIDWLGAVEEVSGIPIRLAVGGDPADALSDLASEAGVRPNPQGLPPWTGQPRRDLASSLLHLRPARVPAGLGVYDLSVSDACTLCGACEGKCPQGALRVRTEGEEVILRFSPALCVGCGLCADACPEGAMEVVGGLSDPGELAWGTWSPRQSSPLARCRRCGRPIGPKRALDRVAAKLREDGMGSLADQVYLCGDCKLAEALGL